jgi:regulator of RNase E activity RraA
MTTSLTLDQIRSHLTSAVVCDVLDAAGYRHQSPRVPLRPMTGVSKIVGRCKTTLWAEMAHEDPRTYDLELKAVDDCQADEVLICAAAGSMRSGIWGELLSTAAANRECAGVIVHGAVRDVEQMTEMGFPVYALGTCIYDSMNRQRVIDLDVVVEIDGVRFGPGDLVLADTDGVVVVPRDIESQIVEAAWDKIHAENQVRKAIRGGMKAREAFDKYGVL